MPEVRSTSTGSAAASIAIEKASQEAWYGGMRELSDQELREIADKANAEATFGIGYKVDKKGNPIQQGIGSDPAINPSINHLASLKKRESLGMERPGTFERELTAYWRANPDWCAKANLPKPEEAI
jgi:hypothetical protein